MELKYLRTFKMIVEEGGFSKAAAGLNYTQSTITFQMQQLEQELAGRTITAVCGHHRNKWLSPLMKLFLELAEKELPTR